MSIMQALMAGAGVVAGSQVITTTTTFVVPSYNTMVVTIEGGTGATGSDGSDLVDPGTSTNYTGGAGGVGGVGGKSIKTFVLGSGPAPGTSVPITISSVAGANNIFGYSPSPRAANGGDGADGQDAYFITMTGDTTYYNGADGSQGANGTATNGDTNTLGGSGSATPQITIVWS